MILKLRWNWHFQTKKWKYTNIVFCQLHSLLVRQFLRLSLYKKFLKKASGNPYYSTKKTIFLHNSFKECNFARKDVHFAWYIGCDPFNQNSNQSDREKWSTSKGGPVFSKLFRLDQTDPLSFGLKFPEILVEWIAPIISEQKSPKIVRKYRATRNFLQIYFPTLLHYANEVKAN